MNCPPDPVQHLGTVVTETDIPNTMVPDTDTLPDTVPDQDTDTVLDTVPATVAESA
jgi:hypothetical protein